MSMHFSFPETGDGRTTPRYMYALTLGRVPSAAAFENGRPLRLPVDSKPISFGPGQVLAVSLDNYISGIQPHVPLATLTKMTIDFGLVYFADGLRWGGGYRMPDSQTLTWRRMGPDYFPGDMDWIWPGSPGWSDQQ